MARIQTSLCSSSSFYHHSYSRFSNNNPLGPYFLIIQFILPLHLLLQNSKPDKLKAPPPHYCKSTTSFQSIQPLPESLGVSFTHQSVLIFGSTPPTSEIDAALPSSSPLYNQTELIKKK
ncbi:hypothetical protein ACJW31_12G154800 [Castanea mollissima]